MQKVTYVYEDGSEHTIEVDVATSRTAAPRAENSRLSCQLVPTDEGAHLVVRVPAGQV